MSSKLSKRKSRLLERGGAIKKTFYIKRYKSIIFMLKLGLGLNMGVNYIQKPFFGNNNLFYTRNNLDQLSKRYNQKNNQVLAIVKKNILNKIIIENETYLISYYYCIILNIIYYGLLLSKYKRKIRIINIHNNITEQKQN